MAEATSARSGNAVVVDGAGLTVADVVRVARHGAPARLSDDALERVAASRGVVDKLLDGDEPVYGVTTGFGDLAQVRVAPEDVEQLQENLILSHACGQGEPLSDEVVRAVLLLRANALAMGLSGVRPVVVERLIDLLNHGVTPVVPSQGSLGASGDLIPLAHLTLVLLGRGEARVDGEVVDGAEALARAGLEPVTLQAKEGLALINGTQVMGALLAFAVHDGLNLVRAAEVAGALSLEALLGSVRPFDPRLHQARPHPGQVASASNLRRLTEESPLVASHADCDRVQDAYTLRCMPQVFGAARAALNHARELLEVEFNSATDNPLIFPEGDAVSGGNFHGEPLALVSAYLGAALAEVANMSERRTARLVDPHLSGLPAFLTKRGGLHSGLMLLQYVAAAVASENKVLAHPAAVDTIPTSANQEDHVSNGATAARNVLSILGNAEKAVAVELICAAQAVDLRGGLMPAPATRAAYDAVRAVSPTVEGDRVMKGDIDAVRALVHRGDVVAAAESVAGPLE